MVINITESARRKLEVEKLPTKSLGVRIRVADSGCNGLAYHMEYCYETDDNDIVIRQKSKKLYVDRKSMTYLYGSDLYYRTTKFKEGYEFVNPNVTSECGCGESFYVV